MGFTERKYKITDWFGERHSFTAKQLYERILEDSESDYCWIAPAYELVRVCKKKHFPEEYAVMIKSAILNCFVNVEHRANCGGGRYKDRPGTKEAVEECYNSLYGVEKEEAISARKRYLSEMVASASYTGLWDPLYHPGPTFKKLRQDWNRAKVEKYFSYKEINFSALVKVLRKEFEEIVKKAEEKGAFDEDKKADLEEWGKIYEELRNM